MISNMQVRHKITENGNTLSVITYESDGQPMSGVLNWPASPAEAIRWIETQRRSLTARRFSVQ